MFRAYDPQRERLVAVKLFKLDLPPERVHLLVGEFERLIAADLSHAVLASPLATGVTGVSAFLVQDYVAAESLDLSVREYGAALPADALRVAVQLGGALDFGAVADIFHGALHPRDVLLSSDETRLTGLGVARALEQVGVVAPVRRPYSAPERVAGRPWDRRADIFSLAALTHELLWGRRVSGTGRQAAEGLTEIAGADLETLRVVFTHALAEEPGDRYETGLEFAEALKQAFPDVAITGPSPTLNPRAPKRRARAQPAAPPAVAEPVAPLLQLADPDPVPAPEPVSTPIVDLPSRPQPVGPLDELVAPLGDVVTTAGPGPIPEPASPPLGAATLESRFAVESPLPDLAIRDDSRDLAAPAPDDAPVVKPLSLPQPTAGPSSELRPDSFSVLERSRSAVWPLVLALVVGIALGFAAGFGLGPRERAATIGGTPTPELLAAELPGAVMPKTIVAVPAEVAPEGAKVPAAALKPAAPVPAEAAPGRVLVRSVPPGARVVVDGRDRGVTPASVDGLTRGTHRVRLTRDGHRPEERRVVITRGRSAQTLDVRLTRERAQTAPAAPPAAPATVVPAAVTGALNIDSRPAGAQVFLDGKLVGVTPVSLAAVPAGDHAIHLDHDGYRRWSSSVRILASQSHRVTASLEK